MATGRAAGPSAGRPVTDPRCNARCPEGSRGADGVCVRRLPRLRDSEF